MKRLAVSFSLLLVLSTQALAQEPSVFEPTPATKTEVKPVGPQLTPEMARYLSDMQRYQSNDLSRQRAQLKAQQRLERISAMKWYGMSNSRPVASATPFMGTYSPGWSGNTGGNPYLWRDLNHYRQSQGFGFETAEQARDAVRR